MDNSAPKIRFKGFTDAWVQRKLGEVAKKVTEKNKDNEFNETLTNSAEYGIINQRDFFDKDISNQKNLDAYYVVCPDDFVYNPRVSNFAPVGSIKRNLLGRTGVMSPLYYVFRFTKGNCIFWEKYFASNYWHSFIQINGDNGARSDRFNIRDSVFEEMILPYPTLSEQTAIGSFFRMLDDIITLHKRKLDGLKELKSGYLQVMFPQNGETVPRVRFNGFEGEWQERKLGEVCSITTGKLDANAMVENGRYDFYTSGIKKYRIDTTAFEGPAITIAGNGATVGYMHLADGKFNAYQRTYVLSNFKANRMFLFSEIGNKLPKKIVEEARTGNIPYIVMNMLTGLKIKFPTLAEQTAIGTFFRSLDEQITDQAEKLEQLKQLKAAYLQKMFI